jgi:hypothetical protein
MAIAHTLKKFPYIPKDDLEKPPDQQTTFHLKTLSAKEQEEVEDSIPTVYESEVKGGRVSRAKRRELEKKGSKVSMKMKTGARVNTYLRIGLMGWDNFKDENGKLVEFLPPDVTGMCRWENIDRLGPDLRFEISQAIEEGNQISEKEEKNSK